MKILYTILLLLLAVPGICSVENTTNKEESDLPYNTETYDRYGNKIGNTDKDGRMYDNYGNYQGQFDKNGNVYDRYGNRTGYIKPKR